MARSVLRRTKRCCMRLLRSKASNKSSTPAARRLSRTTTRAEAKATKTTSSLSTWSGSEEMDTSSEWSAQVEDTTSSMPKSESSTALRDLQAVVINLDRRPDRMEACASNCAAHCPWLPYARLPAVDGKKEPISTSEVGLSWDTAANCVYQRLRSIRKGWNDLDNYVPRELKLSAGERGCSLSHVRAWRQCVELNKPLVVLEDDATPTPEFTPVLSRALAALPPDAHLLYLGYSQAAAWRRELSSELVESEYVWTTVGYIVWPAGARTLLSQLPVSQPVDNWMASFAAAGQLKAYAVRPKIVRQAEEWNVLSDVLHSDEAVSHTIQAECNTSAGRVYLSHDTHHSVDLWSQTGVNQQWIIWRGADGTCTIRTSASTHGGRVYLSHDTHHSVDLWSEAGENQRWTVKTVGGGAYTIQAASTSSDGNTFLGCNGNHGVELFAEGSTHRWIIPDAVFEN